MSHAVSPVPDRRLAEASAAAEAEGEAVRDCRPDSERDFYESYPWCLNPYLTVAETARHLQGEIEKLGRVREGWQAVEVATNVYLLSCALLNSADEYLRGPKLALPRQAPALPFSRIALEGAEKVLGLLRLPRRSRVRCWRAGFQASFDDFLALFVTGAASAEDLAHAGSKLLAPLGAALPRHLQAEHIYFPSAFRKHDLTHLDVLALGRRFKERFPDRQQPLVVLGPRTAGSYFAPVLRAFLKVEGYRTVDLVTVRPDKGPGASERAELLRCARAGYKVLVIDDAPGTGDTVALAAEMAHKAGFPPDRVAALAPVHPASRDWARQLKALPLSNTVVLSLPPEEWHKAHVLEPRQVEARLAEYYRLRGFARASVVASPRADEINARLEGSAEDTRRSRLKRVYEVHLQTADGRSETRYVLAKSVGWGWLGYHAFLAGHRLARFVPPVLGLRDGLLYTEWLPQAPAEVGEEEREAWIDTASSYVAARVRALALGQDPSRTLGLHQHHEGFGLLERVLSRAYGGRLLAGLRKPRVRRRLAEQPCPLPTLIDGKMQRSEWVAGPHGLLKTDYEHHGLGKTELNVTDPAYDLAEVILHLGLSPEEEARLVERYREESGDDGVQKRLFLNEVLAGTWALASALKHLFRSPQLTERQQEFHRNFVAAWHFLTVQAASHFGKLCKPPKAPRWRSPLAVLDIDGVLDLRLFGFPCTTAAGIRALALLHGHDFAVAVDTARSALEVQEYCRAYGLAGGVAEYGSYLWDAVNQRGRALVGSEELEQLERARRALERLPGVFVDHRYQHSVRAYTFEDKSSPGSRMLTPYPLTSIRAFTADDKPSIPVPTLAVQHLMATEGLDALCFHQTSSDTNILSRQVDKGTGLSALLSWVGLEGAETAAVGDSAPDLPMFRVARRSFAPAHIDCASLARQLGCRVSRRPYQRGLLDSVRALAHPDGGTCPRCRDAEVSWRRGEDLFLDLLEAADRSRYARLLGALLDPLTYRVFVR